MPYRFHGSSFFFRVRKIDGRKGRNPNARNLNVIINIHQGNLMEFLIRKEIRSDPKFRTRIFEPEMEDYNKIGLTCNDN